MKSPAITALWETPLRWLLTHRRLAEIDPFISTHGSGPVGEEAFDGLLRDAGLEPYSISENTALLVLGREKWDQAELDQFLVDREGRELRVYSQEMLACYLATGEDPLLADEESLEQLASGHAGLEYLAGWGFPWPSTIVEFPGAGGPLDLDRPETGWLRHLGYSVRSGGPGAQARRAILQEAFGAPLPGRSFNDAYVLEWGPPRSRGRLRKLANTLAALCRNARRRSADMDDPITRWEADLAWLKAEYYDRRHRFPWPRTS